MWRSATSISVPASASHPRRRGARGVAGEERDVGGDLVVARARRVQLAAGRPGELGHPPLDGHVDVLVVGEEREPPLRELGLHRVERREQRVAIGGGDDPGAGQHPRVRPRLAHVVRPQPPVEAQRGVELAEDGVLGLGEAAQLLASVSLCSSSPDSSSPAIGRICSSCSVVRALAIGVDDGRLCREPGQRDRPCGHVVRRGDLLDGVEDGPAAIGLVVADLRRARAVDLVAGAVLAGQEALREAEVRRGGQPVALATGSSVDSKPRSSRL